MLKKAFLCLLIVSALSADDTDFAQNILSEKAKLQELNFDSALAVGSKKDEPLLNKLGEDLSKKMNAYGNYIGVPVLQTEEIIDGVYCHVAYYSDAVITTVLAGHRYGLQVVSNYYGQVMMVNPYYTVERNFAGHFLRHEYFDCTIITGKNQAIFAKF